MEDIILKLKYALISLIRKLHVDLGKHVFFAVFIIVVSFAGKINAFAQEYKVARGIIDVHSTVSDGLYSQEKIAKSAQEKGFKVLIFCESALRKWEYGLWPSRNIIKKTYQENSVLRMGIERYLKRFTALQKQFPGLVLILGLEERVKQKIILRH